MKLPPIALSIALSIAALPAYAQGVAKCTIGGKEVVYNNVGDVDLKEYGQFVLVMIWDIPPPPAPAKVDDSRPDHLVLLSPPSTCTIDQANSIKIDKKD